MEIDLALIIVVFCAVIELVAYRAIIVPKANDAEVISQKGRIATADIINERKIQGMVEINFEFKDDRGGVIKDQRYISEELFNSLNGKKIDVKYHPENSKKYILLGLLDEDLKLFKLVRYFIIFSVVVILPIAYFVISNFAGLGTIKL